MIDTHMIGGLTTLTDAEGYRVRTIIRDFSVTAPAGWFQQGNLTVGTFYVLSGGKKLTELEATYPNDKSALARAARDATMWPYQLITEGAPEQASERAIFMDRGAIIASGNDSNPVKIAVSDRPQDAWDIAGPKSEWALWMASPGYVLRYISHEVKRAQDMLRVKA